MKDALRTILGFVAASAVPTAIYYAYSFTWTILHNKPIDSLIMGVGLLIYVFAFIAAVVFGIPLIFLFRSLQLIRWWICIIVGFVIGAVMNVALQWSGYIYGDVAAWIIKSLPELFVFGCMGAASASVFWLIWKRGDGLHPSK